MIFEWWSACLKGYLVGIRHIENVEAVNADPGLRMGGTLGRCLQYRYFHNMDLQYFEDGL